MRVNYLLLFVVAAALLNSGVWCTVLPIDSSFDARIVGGYEVDITDYPFQVSVQIDGEHHCGGSIISKRSVVTAAHCTEEEDPSSFSIQYGSSYHNSGGQVVKVIQIRRHLDYDRDTLDADISVLTLIKDIIYSAQAQPIVLRSTWVEPEDQWYLEVCGWGTTSYEGIRPAKLHAAEVISYLGHECAILYSNINMSVTRNMICAAASGRDSCGGDSGSPLIRRDEITGAVELVGIVSWGEGCADARYPGVYTNIAMYRSWILSHSNRHTPNLLCTLSVIIFYYIL